TAVDISEVGDNENYPGIVYRVDADFLINSTHPKYELLSWEIIETEGDQNGRINQSETISINMTIGNVENYTDASNVTVSIENDDPHIEIISEPIEMGDIEAGDEMEFWDPDFPAFRVSDDSPIHYSTFTIIVTSDEEFTQTFDLTLTIRHPKYLMIDDDGGERFHEYYEEDLALQPIVHDFLQIEEAGLPTADEISGYEFVIWETGNSENPLSNSEMQLLTTYLDNGGGLLLTGQYIGDEHGNTDFHRDYLKANHIYDNARNYELNGVADNPMTNGLELLLVGGGGAGNGRLSPSVMQPINDAIPIFNYSNETEDVGGIAYDGDYKLVYLGFALEAVSGNGGTNSRLDVIEGVLRHLSDLGVSGSKSTITPTAFEMSYPRPNPFNARTSVQVDVPSDAPFTLEVMDISGRRIAVLHQGQITPGTHTFNWNAEYYPAGIYFFNLNWQNGATVRKVALVK
ncbi:MAG: T9SS type A sorting domain-containing protein, partial [Calditrichaeota bacterium]|nr:T9SS type A sorting domain-containing protein [Calditrichota bacterium]